MQKVPCTGSGTAVAMYWQDTGLTKKGVMKKTLRRVPTPSLLVEIKAGQVK